jgi:hypothetical protein
MDAMSKSVKNDQFLGHDIPAMDEKGLRQFGLMFAGIISVLFGIVLPFLFDYPFPWWPWIVAGVFCILALAVPKSLMQFYRLWMRFGVVMNIIMSRLILGSVFVLTVIPTGMILRLQKKDILNLKMDSESQSYRVESDSNDSDSLKKPY